MRECTFRAPTRHRMGWCCRRCRNRCRSWLPVPLNSSTKTVFHRGLLGQFLVEHLATPAAPSVADHDVATGETTTGCLLWVLRAAVAFWTVPQLVVSHLSSPPRMVGRRGLRDVSGASPA